MDCYIISPLKDLSLMERGNRIFVLAQLYCKYPHYREYIKYLKSKGMWITLDNGAGDYDLVTIEDLIEVTIDLMPNEVIPPDVLFNKDQTEKNLLEFVNLLEEKIPNYQIEIFAVPQGDTKSSWLECYENLLKTSIVTTIGMSKITIPRLWADGKNDQKIMEGRNSCFDYLEKNNLIQKPLHFLGAGDPREFIRYKDNPLARSTDSCFAVWSGINDIVWDEGNFDRIPTPKDYFTHEVVDTKIVQVSKNIDFLRKILT